ncbi:MAG: putative DNA binding domain-containing protein [Streptosporangiaceae bacterium]|nr:putative DNA binding domain-containing protein [Streptosporangiaceae bacterium]
MNLGEIIAGLRAAGIEFEDVEAKRAAGGVPESLASTLAAFANARGGLIILGLDERQGFAATGVPDAAATRNAVVSTAREKLTPPPTLSVEVVPFEGVNLVVTEVEPLPPAQRPCYVTARGLYGGAYVRVGDGDQRLTPYEIDRMRENAGQPHWDDEPVVEASVQDLNRDSFSRLIENARRRSPRVFGNVDEADALAMLGVLVRHEGILVPSLAGLLSVGRYPQQFFPQLMLSVAVYPHVERGRSGPGGIRFLDSAALGGTVPDMVVDAVQVVQRNLHVVSRVIGAGRLDQWEIEPEVIREAVVNALMHRDYSPQARGTQVQVDVFLNRVEVSSPGGLFGNVRLEGLGESGTSSSRNPRLAALLQETGDPVNGRPVAEIRGSGVSLMIDRVREGTGVVPIFTANLDQFRVILPRSSLVTPEFLGMLGQHVDITRLSNAQVAAIALASSGYDIDQAVLRRLGLPSGAARRALADLVALGLLRSRKARDEGPYRLSADLDSGRQSPPRPRLPDNGLGAKIMAALREVEDASREELQQATGTARTRLTSALQELVDLGFVEATAPPHSPNRRYRAIRLGPRS